MRLKIELDKLPAELADAHSKAVETVGHNDLDNDWDNERSGVQIADGVWLYNCGYDHGFCLEIEQSVISSARGAAKSAAKAAAAKANGAKGGRPRTLLYTFDLSKFELGEFVATRFPANCAVSGDWVCKAKSDDAAIAQAKKAAFEEWAAPETREYDDFTVEFIDSVKLKNET